MSRRIWEDNIDVEAIKARCTPQEVEEAMCEVVSAIAALDGLRRLRVEGEPKHEILRALEMVNEALTEVYEG